MLVFISPQKDAVGISKKVKPTHIISISDPGVTTPFDSGWSGSKVLSLKFFDVTDPLKISRMDESIVPNPRIVKDIYNFGKDFEEDSILLAHCHFGISRSSAASIIALTSRHGAIGASKLVGSLNIGGESGYKRFFPNHIMIQYFDEMLHFDGELFDLIGEDYFKKE
jgi:predicted protein tyrosine phosphatase